jgi:hypothetical protein
MTNMLAVLEASSGTYWTPYIVGGGMLLLLICLVLALLAFGRGREHS